MQTSCRFLLALLSFGQSIHYNVRLISILVLRARNKQEPNLIAQFQAEIEGTGTSGTYSQFILGLK